MFDDQYYNDIAQLLNSIVPVEWIKIKLYAELWQESVSVYFYYLTERGEYKQGGLICDEYKIPEEDYQRFLLDLIEVIRDLNNQYRKNDQEKWNSITFLLNSDGEFSVDYGYDDFRNSNINQRRVQWKNKYLID